MIPMLSLYFCLSIFSCEKEKEEKKPVKISENQEKTKLSPIKRGEMLVNGIGCHDCHTPKKMTPQGPALDMDKMLSGHPSEEKLAAYNPEILQSYALFSYGLTAAIGPWGTSFAANLTPHETGIASWTESQFMTAIKKGKYKGMEGGRELLPPMPWQSYSQLPDEDLKAIFAYLKSINPVDNAVPNPIPPSGPAPGQAAGQ